MGEPKLTENPYWTISMRVNHLRFINGLEQKELALRMGMASNTLSNKIKGVTRWSIEELIALAEVFSVSIDYLLGAGSIESAVPVQQKTPAEAGVSGPGEEWARRGSNPRPAD